jgi:hypothetical protein
VPEKKEKLLDHNRRLERQGSCRLGVMGTCGIGDVDRDSEFFFKK